MLSTADVEHLLKDFDVIETLGDGGQATVFLVKDRFGKEMAAKVFKEPQCGMDPDEKVKAMEAFKDVPHIMRPVDVIRRMGVVHGIVMERAKCSLLDLVYGGHLKKKFIAHTIVNMIEGVIAIHDLGWRHNDLKLENILIMKDNRARISDFGLACRVKDLRKMCARAGTLDYLPPEDRIRQPGMTGKSEAADAYAVGVMIFEIILPAARTEDTFRALPLLEDQLPQPYRDVVCGLMVGNPKRRMSLRTALELLKPLRAEAAPVRCGRVGTAEAYNKADVYCP